MLLLCCHFAKPTFVLLWVMLSQWKLFIYGVTCHLIWKLERYKFCSVFCFIIKNIIYIYIYIVALNMKSVCVCNLLFALSGDVFNLSHRNRGMLPAAYQDVLRRLGSLPFIQVKCFFQHLIVTTLTYDMEFHL